MIQADTQPGGGRWTGNANGTLGVRKYLLQNWRADVVATTIDDGTPYEYVRYSPYGVPTSYPAGDANRNGETTTGDFTDMNTVLSGGSAAVVCHIDLNKDGLYPDTADTDFLNDESVLTAKKGGLNKVGTGSAGPSLRLAYAGYAWDPSIKMYHVRHRVYIAEMGRWLTRDPAGYVGGTNLLQYVSGQSLAKTDPTGLIAVDGRGDAIKLFPPLFFPPVCQLDTESDYCAAKCEADPGLDGETDRIPTGSGRHTGLMPAVCCICSENIRKRMRELPPGTQGPPSPGWEDGVDATIRCTFAHERKHTEQCGGSRTCRECLAYRESVDCLTKQRALCKSESCRRALDNEIFHTTYERDETCRLCEHPAIPGPPDWPSPCPWVQ